MWEYGYDEVEFLSRLFGGTLQKYADQSYRTKHYSIFPYFSSLVQLLSYKASRKLANWG